MTTTTTMISMLTIMLMVNISLAMFQTGIDSYQTNTVNIHLYNNENTSLASMTDGENLLVGDELLPVGSDEEDTGNIFTDTFNSMMGWVKNGLSTIKFLGSMLSQPMGFLHDMGLPVYLVAMFGMLWYAIALIIIVSWIGGR